MKNGADEHRAGERDQTPLRVRLPADPNRIRKTSAFLRKLSLNAEKNWHQNSGAKRRAVIRERNMAISRFRT